MKTSILFLLLALTSTSLFAQNAKQYFKAAEKFADLKDYTNATVQYTNSIQLNPEYTDAYLGRALALEKNGKFEEALEDYEKLEALEYKDQSIYYTAASICYRIEKYKEGLSYVSKVLDIKKLKYDGYVLQTQLYLKIKDYGNTVIAANNALEIKATADLHYYKALAFEATNDLTRAQEQYNLALNLKSDHIEALLGLAYLEINLKNYAIALSTANKALATNLNNKESYLVRAKVYAIQLDYPNAINDMSRIIMLSSDEAEMYFIRGNYYFEFTQYQSAINDFSKAILINNAYAEAYYKRAYCYEQVANYSAAIKDYSKLNTLKTYDGNAQELLAKANVRLFELNRESDKPQVLITQPTPIEGVQINYAKDLSSMEINGLIVDASDVKSIVVNEVTIPFDKEKKTFLATVNTTNIDSFTVKVSDVYDNVSLSTFKLVPTEVTAPVITLLAPYSSDNGEVFLDSTTPSLYVEGKITDESAVQSIFIDGVTASFKVDEMNPKFMATIDITNKSSFTITAKDKYGNTTNREFIINRDGISLLENNPMGKTWAVFIENSNYNSFPSLDGPGQDVTLMRSALNKYDIHNIIHKKNMTKAEMDKFFAIELRDLIKSNGVKSVLIWYAGHGKFVNEVGYWIPIDANRNDEFSYFSINTLKSSLQAYNNQLAHTLLITDACESGPTFYQAMRGAVVEKSCGDWQATKLKSSQVFTSAGYELALDNSQFTKTFANMLANNPNSCIPIESIVVKVTQAVAQNKQQKPSFGKISGLSDEDGTFFFISKGIKPPVKAAK